MIPSEIPSVEPARRSTAIMPRAGGYDDDSTYGGPDGGTEGGDESQLVVRDKPRLKKPPMYQVILLNDDYTPMDFVVDVLQRHFDKSYDAATEIMLAVHHQGRGVCGVFTFEVAETKVKAVTDEAKARSYPLKCVIDPK